MSYSPHIQNAIDNGYEFQIGEYFSRGWDYFKQRPLEFIGYYVIVFVLTLVLGIIPLIGFIITIIISPALSVGGPIVANMLAREESPEFGNFFDGFKKLSPLVVAYLLMLVIYFVIALPMIFIFGFSFFSQFAAAGSDPESAIESFQALASMGIWIFLFGLIFLYVGISLRWTLYLVYFHGYDAVEAIKTSWKLTNKKWLYHLGFVLLGGIIMILGFIALLVGALVAIPVYYAADIAGYAEVTGLNTDDELDTIGSDDDTV